MSMEIVTLIVSIFCSVLASSGFWAFLQSHNNRNNAERQMLKGLAHDRIMELGLEYIDRGYLSKDEYENLHDYLYIPYKKLDGNGSAEHIMDIVKKLPVR